VANVKVNVCPWVAVAEEALMIAAGCRLVSVNVWLEVPIELAAVMVIV
jgi:hypothetical protein